ncbi:cytochrome P450 [Coemansia mojavensis]|nr:cytochrome P450 [Coemansia mojavensis]
MSAQSIIISSFRLVLRLVERRNISPLKLVRLAYRVVYGLFFSPLRQLPGSQLSKLSMIGVKIDAALGNLGERTENDYYKYGDIYRIGPKSVVISNPSDVRRVLGTHRFRKSRIYQNFAVVDDTTFSTLSAELTHTRRKQVGPAFTHGHLAAMEPTILECGIKSIMERWDYELAKQQGPDGSAVVNYAHHFLCCTFDVISALGYGQRFHALRDNNTRIMDWVQDTTLLCSLRVIFKNVNAFPISLYTRKLIQSIDEFIAFGNNATDQRREQLRKGLIEKPKDILQALIDSEDPDSKIKMTRSQITAENIVFLVAGTDTTALTLTWTIHYLMLYPRVYKKAVDEVRSKFAHDHLITYAEGKAQLPYVEAVIYEALRIRAVSGTALPRVVPEGGATFQGYFLPGGTQINVNIAGANHHHGTWDNPRLFRPERFIEDAAAKHKVLSFSSGVRICPGRNLAHYEMMTIVANLLKNYDLSLPPNALFMPGKQDADGYPQTMPCSHNLSVGPKFPERDCQILIKKAADY